MFFFFFFYSEQNNCVVTNYDTIEGVLHVLPFITIKVFPSLYTNNDDVKVNSSVELLKNLTRHTEKPEKIQLIYYFRNKDVMVYYTDIYIYVKKRLPAHSP